MRTECLDRVHHPKMEQYRYTYRDSKRWDGVENIQDKTILVYCEQGFGDIIQFARYIPFLKEKCGKVILHCPTALHRLFGCLGVEMVDKESEELPGHDLHVLSMSLPFLLEQVDTPPRYLTVEESEDLSGFADYFNIGIAWEGNPDHSNNLQRVCPLACFKQLQHPKVKLFMLQKTLNLPELTVGCEDMELYTCDIDDFYDTAKAINALDIVISVDTSVLHLAGALGKDSIGILSLDHDARWDVKEWYPTVHLEIQETQDDWASVFNKIEKRLVWYLENC